jgi:hypothetical protein
MGRTGALHPLFSQSQQEEFERSGYVRLGKPLPESTLQAMRDRLDGAILIDPNQNHFPIHFVHARSPYHSPINHSSSLRWNLTFEIALAPAH